MIIFETNLTNDCLTRKNNFVILKRDAVDNSVELLNDYKAFIKDNPKSDMLEFTKWLTQKHSQPIDYLTNNSEVNNSGTNFKVSYLLANVAAYLDMWSKLSFNDVAIGSLADYAILKNVNRLKNPSKKQISAMVVMEPTTCIESIKRLIKNGVLKEELDQDDKRQRRVSLTNQGQELLAILNEKMVNLNGLLFGNLVETEKMTLIPILKKLYEFHHSIHKSNTKQEIKKAFNI
ncbi:MAG: winged helix-turn-helix transcriptional regulator [Bacteroidia bacterium]